MKTYQIQTPIDFSLKQLAEESGSYIGLKNINDVVRFLLTNYVNGNIKVEINSSNMKNVKMQNNLNSTQRIDYGNFNSTLKTKYFTVRHSEADELEEIISKLDRIYEYLAELLEVETNTKDQYEIVIELQKNEGWFEDLRNLSQKIAGYQTVCGIYTRIDSKIIIFIGLHKEEYLRPIFSELTRILSYKKIQEHVPSTIPRIMEYDNLCSFMRENWREVWKKEEIDIKVLPKLEKVDWNKVGYEFVETDRKLHEELDRVMNLVYSYIWNKYGIDTFRKVLNYIYSHPHANIVEVIESELNMSFEEFESNLKEL